MGICVHSFKAMAILYIDYRSVAHVVRPSRELLAQLHPFNAGQGLQIDPKLGAVWVRHKNKDNREGAAFVLGRFLYMGFALMLFVYDVLYSIAIIPHCITIYIYIFIVYPGGACKPPKLPVS